MERIIKLLTDKNHFLERFYLMNEVELINFSKGHFENVEIFYKTREDILEIIRKIDDKIDQSSREYNSEKGMSKEDKNKILNLLDIKDNFVSEILDQDLRVLSFIENEKSSIIKELRNVQKNRHGIRGYRTNQQVKNLSEKY